MIPPNGLISSTQVQFSVIDGLPNGNPKASNATTKVAEIALNVSNLVNSAVLTISLPSTVAPKSGQIVYGNLVTPDGIRVVPGAYNPTRGTIDISIGADDFVSPAIKSLSTVQVQNSRAMVSGRVTLAQSIVQPSVNLYRFIKLKEVGDPDAKDSVYKQDFNVNWNHDTAPQFAGRHVAVVIHGIRNDLSNLSEFAYYLKSLKVGTTKFYDDVYGCDIDWTAHIADNGKLLANILAQYSDQATTIDILAHSQGGLVARWAIEQELPQTTFKGKVSRLFTLGTPHEGVPVSVIASATENGIFATMWPGLYDLAATSKFIASLNVDSVLTSTSYVSVAGIDSADYYSPFGKIANFLEREPCDGIVPISSAQPSGLVTRAKSWKFLPAYYLVHSDLRGKLAPLPNNPLNLDVDGQQRLIDYILAGGTVSGPGTYSVVDLGTLGGLGCIASALSSNGLVVGAGSRYQSSVDSAHGFVWSKGNLTDLGLFGFQGSDSITSGASGVNASGTVLGTVIDTVSNPVRTYAYQYRSGVSTQIQTAIPGAYSVNPVMIHDDGDYVGGVGAIVEESALGHPIYWKQGVEHDLHNDLAQYGTPGWGTAVCVNTKGKVLANVAASDGSSTCYLWQNGTVTPVSTFSGPFKGAWLNDADVVVGGFPKNNITQAESWTSGVITDLGLGPNSFATCINNSGVITGYMQISTGAQHAFLYQAGKVKDLNDLVSVSGWTLNAGVSINDAGQVLCTGVNGAFTETHSFLLSPTSPRRK